MKDKMSLENTINKTLAKQAFICMILVAQLHIVHCAQISRVPSAVFSLLASGGQVGSFKTTSLSKRWGRQFVTDCACDSYFW